MRIYDGRSVEKLLSLEVVVACLADGDGSTRTVVIVDVVVTSVVLLRCLADGEPNKDILLEINLEFMLELYPSINLTIYPNQTKSFS